jgi:NADH-quinone oxidoreductase subunit J
MTPFQVIEPFVFWLVAGLTGLCAIATVVSQNIVRSATWLLFTLAGTSALFFLLGADLVGAVQLLVYVGGTLVLVVFGVMLTAQGPFINMRASGAEWALSVLAGMMLLGVIAYGTNTATVFGPPRGRASEPVMLYQPKESRAKRLADAQQAKAAGTLEKKDALQTTLPDKSNESAVLGEGFLGVGVGPAHKEGDVPVRANYLLPFELVSVHLLVVLIGAAYLARAKRRRGALP